MTLWLKSYILNLTHEEKVVLNFYISDSLDKGFRSDDKIKKRYEALHRQLEAKDKPINKTTEKSRRFEEIHRQYWAKQHPGIPYDL